MRNIQGFMIGLLLSAVAWGQSETSFNAVRLRPSWNSSGGIDLHVSNQTKMPVSTDRLTVELRLRADQPCRFDYLKRINLGPADSVKLTVADAPGARRCLESRSPAGARASVPRALRFERPSLSLSKAAPQLAAPKTDALVVNATWQVRGHALRSESHWLAKPEGR
jgi:hypothetical protein